jgi:hypothetical protein
MKFPDTKATRATEQIMARIRPHLKQEPPPQDSHHFNRTYEAVYDVLTTWLPELRKPKGE